jgi:uncharacterized protein YkwD
MSKNIHHYLIPTKKNNNVPHIFSEKSVAALLMVFVFVFLFATAGKLVVQKTNFLALVKSAVLVDLTNESREQNSIHKLAINPVLEQAAQLKADDMAAKSYFAHTSPEGITPWYWFRQAGYDYRYAGENLAVNFSESAHVRDAWLDSPSHRDNLLQEKFTEIGIATAEGYYKGRKTTFVVQMFGSQKNPPVLETSDTGVEVLPEDTFVAEVEDPETPPVEILGESITETETFIAVESVEPEENNVEDQIADQEDLGYSTLFDRILVNPGVVAQYIYIILGAFILIGLILMSFSELRMHHRKHFVYAFLLVVLVVLFLILNREVLASVFTVL